MNTHCRGFSGHFCSLVLGYVFCGVFTVAFGESVPRTFVFHLGPAYAQPHNVRNRREVIVHHFSARTSLVINEVHPEDLPRLIEYGWHPLTAVRLRFALDRVSRGNTLWWNRRNRSIQRGVDAKDDVAPAVRQMMLVLNHGLEGLRAAQPECTAHVDWKERESSGELEYRIESRLGIRLYDGVKWHVMPMHRVESPWKSTGVTREFSLGCIEELLP